MSDRVALIERKIEEYTPGILEIMARWGYRQVYIDAFEEELAYVMVTHGVARVEEMRRTHWRSVKILGHSTATNRIEAMMKVVEEKSAAAAREKAAREAKKVKVGERSNVEINQGLRLAVILAVIGDEALLEYTMPRGSTSLWIVDAYTWGHIKNVRYKTIPLKWLQAMIEEGQDWTNLSQGNIKKYLGTRTFELRERSMNVQEMYAERVKPKSGTRELFPEVES